MGFAIPRLKLQGGGKDFNILREKMKNWTKIESYFTFFSKKNKNFPQYH